MFAQRFVPLKPIRLYPPKKGLGLTQQSAQRLVVAYLLVSAPGRPGPPCVGCRVAPYVVTASVSQMAEVEALQQLHLHQRDHLVLVPNSI